jgi:hypothetical protein
MPPPAARKLFRLANALLLPLFLVSVAVQHNDPDPLGWMAVYGAAALVCASCVAVRARWGLAAAVGLVALAWASSLGESIREVPVAALFQAWQMKDRGVEEAREVGGLLIVAAWMAFDAAVLFRSARPVAAPAIPGLPHS